jgi:hypothetical protein
MRGVNYIPSCGQCDLPPWEECACSFQFRIDADKIADWQQQHLLEIMNSR